MSKKLRLSHTLANDTPTYGGFSKVEISDLKSIEKGDTANMSSLAFNNHCGTHVDFPKHFIVEGKSGDEYTAEAFIFDYVQVIEIPKTEGMIENSDFSGIEFNSNCEFLIIKSGIEKYRGEEKFYSDYPGMAGQTAEFLLEKMPGLRAIGFDMISHSSIKNREEGRRSHREYLGRGIWIVEDMHLSEINSSTNIKRLTVAPLLFEGCDGAPVTVFGEIDGK